LVFQFTVVGLVLLQVCPIARNSTSQRSSPPDYLNYAWIFAQPGLAVTISALNSPCDLCVIGVPARAGWFGALP